MIPKHKVFISYYHKDDQWYKNELLRINHQLDIFDNLSVDENDIDDTYMNSEMIRREIRDNYLQDSTVLILLCGKNTKYRKHIDWELHGAMYHSDINPQMGILVINLPTINQPMISATTQEEQVIAKDARWSPISSNRNELEQSYKYLPSRILDNVVKQGPQISVVNWNDIIYKGQLTLNSMDRLKLLIDIAFKRRFDFNYDHSAPLRRNNS